MIISASYRTDIPALYGEWFMNGLRSGYCMVANPYSRQVSRVSLLPGDVDGIVFWTRNIAPLMRHLPEIRDRGFAFVVQHTITGYPRALEPCGIDPDRLTEGLCRIASDYGPKVCVWRYDTIVDSTLTPWESHRCMFGSLARRLAGAVDEVVISFAHGYRKTQRRMAQAAREHGFAWQDPDAACKRRRVIELAEIAAGCGMRLSVCAQPQYLAGAAVAASCIDARRIEAVGGRKPAVRVHGNRPECACHASRDIGAFDTCTLGCVYCYAVTSQEAARRRMKEHDPQAESLGG